MDLSTRYDFHVTVTNGERPLGNVPVYYQYGGKSYFLGFTGPDGVAEGLCHPSLPIVGVQYHPERQSFGLLRPDAADGAPLFHWLRQACQKRMRR